MNVTRVRPRTGHIVANPVLTRARTGASGPLRKSREGALCCQRDAQPMIALVRDLLQLTVMLAVLIAVFGSLERVWGLRQQKLFRKSFGIDLLYYFLSGILPRLLLILPLSLLARLAHHFFGGTFYQWTAAMPLAVRVLLAAIVGDIGSYWGHRWSHEIPWLWRFHSVHHSAEELDWLVNTRAHLRGFDLHRDWLAATFPCTSWGSRNRWREHNWMSRRSS